MTTETTDRPAKAHRWGTPGKDGIKACTKTGCTVRAAGAYSMWQRKPGGHWRGTHRELIPDCKGTETT